jgi:ActR/RegA family two-component response regulator
MPQKIVVAETDTRNARMAEALQQRGFEVVTASDASHALAAARQERPEVVIIANQLAGGTGVVALKRIRSNVYTTNIPVLMLVKSDREAREALRLGAQECLEPQPDADKLHAAIQKHLLEDLDFTAPPAEVVQAPERLEALRETGLLDSPAESSFDRLTRLTQRLLAAPTALVSLVDRDRQFFKSQAGLGEPYASARQTELSHSFCQWVVAAREKLVVEDARQHAVLKSNLAVRYMNVQAYAGVPIHAKGGEVIGSFCAIDHTARKWTEEELETLKDLAQVTEAYAHLATARQQRDATAAATSSLSISADVAGRAIQGVARILRRFGNRLDASERDELLQIVEEQSAHLVESVAGR